MVNELVEESIQASPMGVYCFLTSTMNYLTAKNKDDEEEENETKATNI